MFIFDINCIKALTFSVWALKVAKIWNEQFGK